MGLFGTQFINAFMNFDDIVRQCLLENKRCGSVGLGGVAGCLVVGCFMFFVVSFCVALLAKKYCIPGWILKARCL